jgi:hypothetical protein
MTEAVTPGEVHGILRRFKVYLKSRVSRRENKRYNTVFPVPALRSSGSLHLPFGGLAPGQVCVPYVDEEKAITLVPLE